MIIVIDTTETFSDLFLEGTDFTLLHNYIMKSPAKLKVPEIVFLETINHYREMTEKMVFHTEKYINKLKITEIKTAISELDITELCNNYKSKLQEKLRIMNAEILNFDSINIKDIVERSLKRRKPFDPGGRKGFRDAIIWESLLQLLEREQEQIILITKNKNNFCDQGVLAEDLCQDLMKRDLPKNIVTIVNGLTSFVDKYVKQSLANLEELRKNIQEGEYDKFNAEMFYKDNLNSIHETVSNKIEDGDFWARPSSENITIGNIWSRNYELVSLNSNPIIISVNDVWNINDNDIAIRIKYDVGGVITYARIHDEGFINDQYDEADYSHIKEIAGYTINIPITVILNKSSFDVSDFGVGAITMII